MIDFDGDELYILPIFEDKMRKDLSAVHPSQLIFNVSGPGLDARTGFLDQNSISLQNYLDEDEHTEHYEVLS